jgi:hypothetical protein
MLINYDINLFSKLTDQEKYNIRQIFSDKKSSEKFLKENFLCNFNKSKIYYFNEKYVLNIFLTNYYDYSILEYKISDFNYQNDINGINNKIINSHRNYIRKNKIKKLMNEV